jgi:hypothetical protein
LADTDDQLNDLKYVFTDNNDCLGIPSEDLNPKSLKAHNESAIHQRYQYTAKPILRHFYRTPANLFEVNVRDFSLRINPLLNLDVMPAVKDDELLFNNKRGIELRGIIDDKIYFSTRIVEAQSRFANYSRSYISEFSAIPGAGFYKTHNSKIFGVDGGHDYLTSKAHVGLNVSKHVGIELGHGSHFIGNGIRSLLMSDFGNDYFYLKFNTKVWKLQYQNIFAELNPISAKASNNDVLLPKKYSATHYLSINIGKRFSLGLFESVVFARQDNFEFQYLNPIILYRTVEHGLGSPDNVLIGLNAKYNFRNRLQFYGQFLLDEFSFDRISDGNDWWGNKFGLQVGAKYLNAFGINNLDLALEFNRVRPYTYTHRDSISNYAHSNLAIAHPLGANFREGILDVRYRPHERWMLAARLFYMQYGENINGENYGKNILEPSSSRVQDEGVTLLQGDRVNTSLIHMTISYQVFHNMFVDGIFSSRNAASDTGEFDSDTFYAGIGLRINMKRYLHAF